MTDNITCGNVDSMVRSVRSNSDIIEKMLKRTVENDKEIREILTDYSRVQKCIDNSQIELYRQYIGEKDGVAKTLSEYSSEFNGSSKMLVMDLYKGPENCKQLHQAFVKINEIQIKIINILSKVLGISNLLLGSL